ncbi:protein tesmin/TSO1-like CXC 3 isoform X1 [Citrus sinensis]|uniref:protein tesmin/TSO1-like CXC 3 isoform X2 n=1 Tax=Citrus clementina TaxID=85681 RepID=UPI000CED2924|nr:protein tesmin/TSO1-like CXC 3 isoform X2 [Citrus x clementina]XP_024951272.2 protein tesmin/TSO1-like CXC 3 isoform X1 [Citrus sinensis]
MESPEGDRIKATSLSTPGSSPAVQESPVFNFISNLSPINSVKAARYTQRFFETQFPTPPPVFRTPRLDLQRETSFLKSNDADAASRDYGDCGNRMSTVLVPCMQKELQSCSPSGCVDDYLTDPVEVEGCSNSNELCVQPAKNVSKLSSSGFNSPTITSPKVNGANDRNSEDFMHMLPDQAEQDPLRSLALFETAIEQRDAESFDGSHKLTPTEKADQNTGTQHNGQDGRSQSPKNLQNVEADKNSSENVGPVSTGLLKESTSHQRGIRRHLQFEAALAGKCITTSKSHSSHNVTQESDNSTLPASFRDWESLIPSDIEPREVSSGREATSSSQNVASRLSFCQSDFVRSSQNEESLPLIGPLPPGFSLHLSSMAELMPISSDLMPTGRIHDYMKNDQLDDQAVVGASLVISQYTDSMKQISDSLQMTLSEQQAAPCEGMMLTSEIEELNQGSPKKKRKKASNSSESEDCKRCNCKKSKCLKLYCDCFAAGIYCIDSCACESCFNKPEYEETVTDTRQQIQSRNPLAFAPKIVGHADSAANVVEDGNLTTPASARHKRGCNCKKSKCLKKYCECFQANVGCSDGCRCEGCSNSFGRKTESKYQKVQRWENQSHVKLDAAANVTDSTKTRTIKPFSARWEDLPDMSHLTPLSYSYPEAEASSVSPSMRDFQNVRRTHLHHESSFQSVNPHWQSPMSSMPQFHEDFAEHNRRSSYSKVHDTTKEDNMPEIQKDTSTPSNASKADVPNRKQISPPQFQSQELRSSSTQGGLESDRKFSWKNVPSFPPLTPYSKSKDDIGQTGSDFKGHPNDNR